MDKYIVIDEIFVSGGHVVILNKELGDNLTRKAYIGDDELFFIPNSVKTWIQVKTLESLIGKTIEFR